MFPFFVISCYPTPTLDGSILPIFSGASFTMCLDSRLVVLSPPDTPLCPSHRARLFLWTYLRYSVLAKTHEFGDSPSSTDLVSTSRSSTNFLSFTGNVVRYFTLDSDECHKGGMKSECHTSLCDAKDDHHYILSCWRSLL